MWGSLAGRTIHADIVPGEYSLEVNITPTQADLGAQFTVNVGIFHSGQPNYQAVQWKIDYNQPQVTYVSAVEHTGAPSVCTSISDNGDTTLLGCLDLSGPNLTYSGIAYDVTYQCAATEGIATLNLVETTGATAQTFVKVSTTQQPIHTHGDSISCGGAPPADTPTPAPTLTVGPPESPTATPVSPGPAATPTPLPPGWEAIPLFAGCQFEAWTGASGTGPADLAGLVGPAGNLIALWAQQPPPLWRGYSPQFPEVSDLGPVDQLDVLAICSMGSGDFSRPII
jgi:hypothetical protein